MKYTTKSGVDVEVKMITLKERDKFLAVKAVQEAFADTPTWDERLIMHDKFIELCDLCNIPVGAVGEGDIVEIISILLNGCLPSDFPSAQ